MTDFLNYIDGKLVPSLGGDWIDVFEPAIGTVYARIPRSVAADIEIAVSAAHRAKTAWASAPARVRSDSMLRIASLVEDRLEEFARAESRDTGKPLALARRMDIPRASQNFHFFATAILHQANESHDTDGTAINYTLRSPLGLAGCISPWNLPLYLFTWKIAPAIAAGNCVIAKPSEITPATAALFSQVCIDAGLPPGVLNIVHGYGNEAGDAIVSHPDIPAISFTGGTATGAAIARTAAPMFKKLSLELGGKNPTLVCADCDFEETLSTVLRSAFTNQGEICLCGSRILIEQPLYARFRDAFVERASALKVGDPLLPDTEQGALVSRAHLDKVLGYLELAQQEGGSVLCGGEALRIEGRCREGWFLAPTVIEGLSPACRTNQEEIFGPVVTLQPFTDDAHALQLANDSGYGLAASVWTRDVRRAQALARSIDCGIVWVNCWMLRDLRTPFGGMKHSGVGREGGWDALRFFTEAKNVCIAG